MPRRISGLLSILREDVQRYAGESEDIASRTSQDGAIIAEASSDQYHGFDGLGLRCVIEQPLPDTAAVTEALRTGAHVA